MTYTLSQGEFTAAKRRLTIAKRKGPAAVVTECKRTAALFHAKGFPDAWHTWRMAFEDAANALSRTPGAPLVGANPFD